jgi:hypothetical protein
LLPAFDSGENAARIGRPDKRFWISVGFDDETVDSDIIATLQYWMERKTPAAAGAG